MKNLSLILLCFFFMMSSSFAKIRMNISIVYKKGIDKGLVLVSEFHSVEEVDEGERIRLQMKNDLKIIIFGHFIDSEDTYGPSDLLKIEGSIYIRGKKLKDTFFNSELNIPIGVRRILVYQDSSGQLIELSILPEIR